MYTGVKGHRWLLSVAPSLTVPLPMRLRDKAVVDKEDGMYNYTRILCHFGSLVMELCDAWQEGDGERVL